MARKLFAGGLLLVACLGMFAVQASSQDKNGKNTNTPPLAVEVAADKSDNVPLGPLVQELKNVREQRAELDRREKQLIALIAQKVEEARQQLDRDTQSQRQKLDQIESLLRPEAKRGGAKAMKTEAKTEDKNK
jgi:hypothetical protein